MYIMQEGEVSYQIYICILYMYDMYMSGQCRNAPILLMHIYEIACYGAFFVSVVDTVQKFDAFALGSHNLPPLFHYERDGKEDLIC